MFMDALLMLSDAQALTATALSTNTIDLGNPTIKNRIGTGQPLVVAVQVDVAADFTTTDETYEVQVISSASANLSSATILARYPLLASQLAVGKKFALPIPPGMPSQRYLGVNYVLAGTTPLVTLTASVMPANMAEAEYTYYPKGYSA
jgi:hypothetical protein